MSLTEMCNPDDVEPKTSRIGDHHNYIKWQINNLDGKLLKNIVPLDEVNLTRVKEVIKHERDYYLINNPNKRTVRFTLLLSYIWY